MSKEGVMVFIFKGKKMKLRSNPPLPKHIMESYIEEWKKENKDE